MSVYVHNMIDAVAFGGHEHLRDHGDPGDERTWGLSCTAECEERILTDTEFSARHAGGVPLTEAEKAEHEAFDRAAQKDVNRMAMALSQLAKEQIATPVG